MVIIQTVYSQSPPANPEWATHTLKCGLFPFPWHASVEYSASKMSGNDRLTCGYIFFREWFTSALAIVLAYLFLMMSFGYMSAYFNYLQVTFNGLFMGCITSNCVSSNTNCCSRVPVLFLFLLIAGLAITFVPEIVLVYHVIFDLYLLGGNKFIDCNMCNFCPDDVRLTCCGTVVVDKDKGGNGPVTEVAPTSSPALVPPGPGAGSMFNDPLNLRPRIQFVTKYKPVPIGPPNP
jgi:hypothetical protein